jgi:hypothetical protein
MVRDIHINYQLGSRDRKGHFLEVLGILNFLEVNKLAMFFFPSI